MEEKVSVVLKLIQEDGDSFAKRAEMYYKKRPELISFVEESFRAYRALAERYDHISKELQSANNTLASAFPDQFQYMMDEDDDESSLPFPRRGMKSASKNAKIPEAPKNFPTRNIKAIMALAANKGGGDKPETPPKRSAGSKQKKKTKTVPESGLTESQAIKEIDKLQKTILTRQTEKEFYKSNYEKGVAKYRLIEQDITQMQEKISKLQDEFGVRKAIEDDEARTLMAQAALKSCQEKLAELQKQQEKSAKEAKIEREKVKQARDRLLSLRRCVDGGQEDGEVHNNQSQPLTAVEREQEPNSSDAADKVKELEMLRDKIKERFMADSTMSVTEMAEKINELVKKAINLETSVASQSALIQRLKLEAGDLQGQVQTLEDEKAGLTNGNSTLTNKLKDVEDKLKDVQDLDRSVQSRNNKLQTQLTEAHLGVDVMKEKLPEAKSEEEENSQKKEELEAQSRDVPMENDKHKESQGQVPGYHQQQQERESKPQQAAEELYKSFSQANQTQEREKEMIKQNHEEDEEDQQKQPSSTNELEGKHKVSQEEYNSVLHNYEEVRKRLTELENQPTPSTNELEGKHKALLDEYNSVLHNYEEVKKRLTEVENQQQIPSTNEPEESKQKVPLDEYYSVLHNYEEVKKRLTEVENQQQIPSTNEPEESKQKVPLDEYNSVLHNYEEVKKRLTELESQPNQRHPPTDELEGKHKNLLDEYNSIRHDYEEVKNRLTEIEENQQNQQQLQLSTIELEEKHKALLDEYNMILHKYEDVKKRLTEVENRNFKELNELRNLNAKKDEEILSLHQKLILLQKKLDDLKHMKDVKVADKKETNPLETPKNDEEDEEDDDDDYLLKLMATQKHVVSPVEEKLRVDIDEILEENLEFWMRFSASFSQIQKFQDEIDDLHRELTKIEHRRREATGSSTGRNMGLDTRPIYRHMKQIHTELGLWADKSVALKDELKRRFTQLCNIQTDITRALNDGAIDDEMKFTSFQAAKFQGEVLNMQQENSKVGDELQAGLDHVANLQSDVEKTLKKLSEDLGSKQDPMMQTPPGNQVPLKSFIFGVKPKKQKQSIFSSVNPSTLQKKYQQLKF